MPTYEHACLQCGKEGEQFRPMAESHVCPPCAHCGGETQRILSAVQGIVHFPAAGGQGYVSHTSGKWIETKKAREEDLKRTGCRPYEGFGSESRQVAKDNAHAEKKADEKLEVAVREAYAQLTPDKKAALSSSVP